MVVSPLHDPSLSGVGAYIQDMFHTTGLLRFQLTAVSACSLGSLAFPGLSPTLSLFSVLFGVFPRAFPHFSGFSRTSRIRPANRVNMLKLQ